MTPHDLTARLRQGEWGRWSGLVGAGWPAVVRVLHPARRRSAAGTEHVPWSELPGAADRDLSRAAWHDVSGVRLYAGRTSAGWTDEPLVGTDGEVAAVLLPLLAAREPTVWIGQWQGWGSDLGLRDDLAPRQVVPALGRAYDVVSVPVGRVLAAVGPVDGGHERMPDLVWSTTGRWLQVCDVDLPCTLVGCDAATASTLLASTELEAVLVDPQDQVVT